MIPIEQILVKNSPAARATIKNRCLSEGLLENKCAICGHPPEWLGRPLMLQMDHINGDASDNRLENLRVLCPHCHTQTDTYCSRNKSGAPSNRCPECSTKISRYSKTCRAHTKRAQYPPIEDILQMLETMSYVAVARAVGVTDNSIRTYLRSNGVEPPMRRSGNTKIVWPNIDALITLVNEYGYKGAGKMLGVSDVAVKQYLLRNGGDGIEERIPHRSPHRFDAR